MKSSIGLLILFIITFGLTWVVQLTDQQGHSFPQAKPFTLTLSTPEEVKTISQNNLMESTANYCRASDYEQAEISAHQKFFASVQTAGNKIESRNIKGLRLTDLTSKLDILELALEDVRPEFLQQFAKNCREALCVTEKLTGSKEAAFESLI